ncbi:hypothetical protein PIB30_045209 [Stylosanthes scabra]|uniref:F-box protein n=1 Tax=Stylosanthes scabra TaxID=79078 RepID=A0ABU6RGE6_9FABA|nr:hypothetical protein [Stylosanthes scabra]
MGFWVLRCSSGSKKWHPLSLPPTLHSGRSLWDCLIWRDKLFLEVGSLYDPQNMIFYVYDPQTDDSWKQLIRIPFFYYDHLKNHPPSIMPVLSLGDVGNCNVAMMWTWPAEEDGYPPNPHEFKIHALLVDNEEYCIRGNQCLDEVSEAIIPSSFDFHDINVNFVDLGKASGKWLGLLKCPTAPFFSPLASGKWLGLLKCLVSDSNLGGGMYAKGDMATSNPPKGALNMA